MLAPDATEGVHSRVVDELKPLPKEYVLEKHAYSAFFGTSLDYLLKSLGVETVVLAGLDADICVRHTAADAFFRGYRVVVVRDAVAARLDKNWEDYYKAVYGATIVDSAHLEEFLSKPRDPNSTVATTETDKGQAHRYGYFSVDPSSADNQPSGTKGNPQAIEVFPHFSSPTPPHEEKPCRGMLW